MNIAQNNQTLKDWEHSIMCIISYTVVYNIHPHTTNNNKSSDILLWEIFKFYGGFELLLSRYCIQ